MTDEEIHQLRTRAERAELALTKIRCIYCNAEYGREQSNELADHIVSCDKSPVVQLTRIYEGILDMMVDEFARIAAISSTTDEVVGLCNRAMSKIRQTVPVITQRDEWKSRAERAEAACAEKDTVLHLAQNRNCDCRAIDDHNAHCSDLYWQKVNHALSTDCGKDFVSLGSFWNDLSQWSQNVFGTDLERGPIGPLKHLAKEVNEALSAPKDISEYADCFILVCDASRRAGFGLADLIAAVEQKHATNKTRNYPRPVGDEPSEHVRLCETKVKQ